MKENQFCFIQGGELMRISHNLGCRRFERRCTNDLPYTPGLVTKIRHRGPNGKDGATHVPQDSFGIGAKQKALQALLAVGSQDDQVHFVLLNGGKKLIVKGPGNRDRLGAETLGTQSGRHFVPTVLPVAIGPQIGRPTLLRAE